MLACFWSINAIFMCKNLFESFIDVFLKNRMVLMVRLSYDFYLFYH